MFFNKRYKLYINVSVDSSSDKSFEDNGEWFQCYPTLSEFKRSPFEKELFTRQSWGVIEFKNNPLEYSTAVDKRPYQLYDIIYNLPVNQEIRVKAVISNGLISPDSLNTIYGYFGTNDCEFDDDKKLIKATPSILDQYTNLVENMETEVSVFGGFEEKMAVWGMQSGYYDTYPSGFSAVHSIPMSVSSTTLSEAKDVTEPLMIDALIKPASVAYAGKLTVNINADTVNSDDIDIYLEKFNSNDAQIDSVKLITFPSTGNAYYEQVVDISLAKGDYLKLTTYISNPDVINYTYLHIALKITTVPYQTNEIDISMQESGLKEYPVWVTINDGFTDLVRVDDYESDINTLTQYFEDVTNAPKTTLLTENQYAPESRIPTLTLVTNEGLKTLSIGGLYIPDLESLLGDSGLELSALEVFECKVDYNGGWFGGKRYRVRAKCAFSRFESWQPNDGTEPDGGNWIDTTFIQNGKRLWVKKPFDGQTTQWTLGVHNTSGGTDFGIPYRESLKSIKAYPSASNSVKMQSRDLYDVIKTVYNNTHSSLNNKDVKSVFLWNSVDYDIDVPSGINYVTKDLNYLNNIACVHSYLLNPETDNDSEDSKLLFSFKGLMDDLKKMFNNQIFWWVDYNYDLHIEHVKYIDITSYKSILDTTTGTVNSQNSKLLSEISSWSHDKDEMYSLIDFTMINASYADFNKNKITYDKIVSNKRNQDIKNLVSISKITTDIRFCIENPLGLENSMILINHDGSYKSVNADVPVAGSVFLNGNLAMSNLLTKYKYEGIFLSGKINGVYSEFDITSRTRSGKEITLKGIYDYDYFKTKLGVGMIDSLTHNLDNENTKIVLKYRYGSGNYDDTFTLMISILGDSGATEDVEFDLG